MLGFKGLYNKLLMQTLARRVVERLWEVIFGSLKKDDMKKLIQSPSILMHDAARVGNVEILIVLIRSCVDLICIVDDDNKTMFHVAAENRQEDVFTLIYEIERIDTIMTRRILSMSCEKNKCFSMLHMVAKLAAPSHLSRVSGAVLQYQRESAWMEVCRIFDNLSRSMFGNIFSFLFLRNTWFNNQSLSKF